MITNRLKILFLISIPVFFAHSIEEYYNNMYNVDSTFRYVYSVFQSMSIYQTSFIQLSVMIWLILIISFLLIYSNKWHLRFMLLLGIIYVLELHHIVKAIVILDYYPGVVTSSMFLIIGIYYWKEIISIYRHV